AGPPAAEIPERQEEPAQLRPLQRRGARRPLRSPEPPDRQGRAAEDSAPVREARARRAGIPVPYSLVAAHRPALVQSPGLEGHAEPLCQPGFAGRLPEALLRQAESSLRYFFHR